MPGDLCEEYAVKCSRSRYFLGYWLKLAGLTPEKLRITNRLDWQKLRVWRMTTSSEDLRPWATDLLTTFPDADIARLCKALDPMRG